MLQKAFKEEALSHTQVFEWFAPFKRREMSAEHHSHSGRPSTSRTDQNVETIREQINEDHRYTIDEISGATGVSRSSCQRILIVNLNMRRDAAKFVPRPLTQDQKNTRLTLYEELKNQIESDQNFLSEVITGDEIWCYGYDPETKQASSQWKTPTSPRPKKARQMRSNVKTMLIFFRCSRNRAPGIRSFWTGCQSGILLGGYEAIERECAKKTPRNVEIG